jgi:predicted TPR repeat methyltransferase
MILLARIYTRNTDFEAGASALRKAITFRPDDPQLRVNLGEVLFQGGHHDEALDALYDANRLDGTHLQALDGLSSLLLAAAQAEMSPQIWAEARSFLETFCVLAPGNVAKRWRLAECYDREGNVAQRKRVLKEIIALESEDSGAAYLLAAMESDRAVTEGNVGYVRDVFDAAAINFDKALVDDLHYVVPQKIRAHLDCIAPTQTTFQRVLDLGCGTGLLAEAIGDRCNEIFGVDISSKMVEIARSKGGYTHLSVESIDGYLHENEQIFDVIVAADVLIYIGELEPTFRQIYEALGHDGVFIFSLEYASEPGFQLNPSGRFSYSQGYMDDLMERTGFETLRVEQTALRMEGSSAVQGMVYSLRKTTVANPD